MTFSSTVFSRIQAAACIKFFILLLRLVFKGGVYSRAACIKFSLVWRRKIICLQLEHSFFRDSFLMLSSETIPKGTLYTWRGSTDANFGAKMYITIPRGIFGEG